MLIKHTLQCLCWLPSYVPIRNYYKYYLTIYLKTIRKRSIFVGIWTDFSFLQSVPIQSDQASVRAGVHAPTKSVSVPAAISVVLIFHVSLWTGSTRGRHDKVIWTTTDMSA
jgi:hypothetical protein